MSDCYWARRTLGLVKDPKGHGMPAYVWTVEDVNKANDYREFWWAMNLHPDHTVRLSRDHAVVTGSEHGNRLFVHFVLPDSAAYPKPHRLTLAQDHQQYGSYAYPMGEGNDPKALARAYRRLTGHLEYGPVFYRPRVLGKVAGYNGRFMAIMIPRKKGAAPAAVESLKTLDNSLAVRITVGAVEDTLIWSYEHGLLEAGDISARGQWCLVRRAPETGRVLDWALGGGTRLEVAGRRLKG
jgi:hypothetical protein